MNRRRVALAALAALLLASTFLHPSLRLHRTVFRHVVVFDISQSMNTPDCPLGARDTSRLACAKTALAEALRELPCGSELSWGAFTGYQSFVLSAPVEVCDHRAELQAAMQPLDWRVGWEPGSEVARGLRSALDLVRNLATREVPAPDLVFVTDGHEAPPISDRYANRDRDKTPVVRGAIIGVGGDQPVPIPKYDMDGKLLGVWELDDVPQADLSAVRGFTSVPGERMAGVEGEPAATAGNEHLSSLREGHLRELARDHDLAYARLERPDDMLRALTAPHLERKLPVDTDMRWALAVLALLALLLS